MRILGTEGGTNELGIWRGRIADDDDEDEEEDDDKEEEEDTEEYDARAVAERERPTLDTPLALTEDNDDRDDREGEVAEAPADTSMGTC